ncbi:hypothetical protein IU487_22220 [Nocardia puris]|uniref:hypothetical protein n=1 Tax=Nocardia puris TaxID=208602 RepID=UPI0018957CFA|nr:hypothetical protein [Nocardia puris]MBF6213736.1 hypothetical protein [Nocardia puris]
MPEIPEPTVRCTCTHRRTTHLHRIGACQGRGLLGGQCRCEVYEPADREEADR